MSTRLDLTLQKHPDHEEGIRLLASRDPSGNLKYLDWGAKVLASGQALAGEIADVLELFHQFAGHGIRQHQRPGRRAPIRISPDLYSYRPQDLAGLRTNLFKLKRAQDRKRKKRERLYRIQGEMEADVVYDSPDLIVRHIKNKQASVHYGLRTQWCISMLREGHFEEYETNNATFFFFERKTPKDDEFDKIALMMPRTEDRNGEDDGRAEAFTSTDRRVDMMMLAKVHGPRIFDIFREIYERSVNYPGSDMARIYSGSATLEQMTRATTDKVVLSRLKSRELESFLVAICCNDATPWSILEEVLRGAPALSKKHCRRDHFRRRYGRNLLVREVTAAIVIHPATPIDVRERLVKDLRRRHVNVGSIRRTTNRARISVEYGPGEQLIAGRRVRRYRRRRFTLTQIRSHFRGLEGRLKRAKKAVKKKIAEKGKPKRVRRGVATRGSSGRYISAADLRRVR